MSDETDIDREPAESGQSGRTWRRLFREHHIIREAAANILMVVVVALITTTAGLLTESTGTLTFVRDVLLSKVSLAIAVSLLVTMGGLALGARIRARKEADSMVKLRRATKHAYIEALRLGKLVRGHHDD